MGAWSFVEPFLEWVLGQLGGKSKRARYAGRPATAGDRDRPHVETSSPAQGLPRRMPVLSEARSTCPIISAS